MHSTYVAINGKRWTCHHNGDFSGDVLVSVVTPDGTESTIEYPPIPFELMKRLVAEWVRQEEIGRLDQSDANEILLAKRGSK